MTRARLGQNFLIDKDWQQRIVDYFSPSNGFGEIGPGRGELTHLLEKKYSSFTVFEKDTNLVALHRAKTTYQTVAGDFLDWNFCFDEKPVENFSFIGNLPYESGTAIVKRVTERSDQVEGFVFMLQKEVVERLCAKPHTRDFGSLTVLVQGQFEMEALGVVPPRCFDPAPEVTSQVVRARRRSEGRHSLDRSFQKFVQSAFLQKRKTFRNALRARFDRDLIDRVCQSMGYGINLRAEEIPVDLWPQFYEALVHGR